jgi:hypothetical protein
MPFETKKDVLDWYERHPRTLTPEFISSIEWGRVKEYPLDKKFVPVLLYMRDVETLTDMYHRELKRTPTGRDPVIARFMERWGVEELTHGTVLNRFLNEAGIDTPKNWPQQVRHSVSMSYHTATFCITAITNLIGRKFTAAHMAFGAIHEYSTTQAYRRLGELAAHPILDQILQAIIREESLHANFYAKIAEIELAKDKFARRLARKLVEKFWKPVGQGSIEKERTEYAVALLFDGFEGIERIEKLITQRIRQFPGFEEVNVITERVKEICSRKSKELLAAEI